MELGIYNLLTIGKMSLACDVSIKTLRHYERIGLLKPADIDEDSGYRYYSLDQIDTMIQISRCKRFGFSLQVIAQYLHSNQEEKDRMLENQADVLSSRIRELQTSLNDQQMLRQNAAVTRGETVIRNYEIKVEETTKRPVFAHRTIMSTEDFGKAYGELFEDMAKNGIRLTGPNGSRYYDSEFDHQESDIEVFVPVDDSEKANSSIGGTLSAKTIHKGSYSSLNEAYSALVCWIEENGYETIGAPYELYTKNAYERIPADQWETEIYFPVKKKAD